MHTYPLFRTLSDHRFPMPRVTLCDTLLSVPYNSLLAQGSSLWTPLQRELPYSLHLAARILCLSWSFLTSRPYTSNLARPSTAGAGLPAALPAHTGPSLLRIQGPFLAFPTPAWLEYECPSQSICNSTAPKGSRCSGNRDR